jgi:hypothetical protein
MLIAPRRHTCTDGDWGVGDQASLEAALEAAGQSSSDRAALCPGGYHADRSAFTPCVWASGSMCLWQSGTTTSCSATFWGARRLCRCA